MPYLIGLGLIILVIYLIVKLIIWLVVNVGPVILKGTLIILVVGAIGGLFVGTFYGIKNYMASTHENISHMGFKIAMMAITSVFILALLGGGTLFAYTNGGDIVSGIANLDYKNINLSDLNVKSKALGEKVVSVDSLSVYKSKTLTSGVKYVLPKDSVVEVLAVWPGMGVSKIRHDKRIGYAQSMYLRDMSEPFVMKVVESDALNVRAGPSGNADIKFVLYKGNTVRVYEEGKSDGWVKIEYEGREGYVAERLLGEVK